jgi:multiple antibiotic resistance protein
LLLKFPKKSFSRATPVLDNRLQRFKPMPPPDSKTKGPQNQSPLLQVLTVRHIRTTPISCCPVAELSKFFGLAFSALLPLVNPLGDALVFLGLVGGAPPAVYRALARKVAISTTLFLLTIELVGTAMLKFFGISLPVMQVSGGLVLAAMGWSLLSQSEPEPKEVQTGVVDGPVLGSLERKIFYPFTFPITAGPGSIVVMVTLSAHASVRGALPDIAAHAGIALAVVLLSVAVYFCYGHSPTITAHVSSETVHGILRVIAFVLLCIGVQITWNGVQALLKTALKP